ncbi:hypothetical protein EV426DRAFT_703746 [Tirmania nivea]|nr:hypothetical protein EV426DRAFT_703746 [Tirmania nivea]
MPSKGKRKANTIQMDPRKSCVPVTKHLPVTERPQHNPTPPPVQLIDDCTNTTTAEIIAPPTSELSERECKAAKFNLQRLIRDSIPKESTQIEKWLHHIQGLAELSGTSFRDLNTKKRFQDWIIPEPPMKTGVSMIRTQTSEQAITHPETRTSAPLTVATSKVRQTSSS